MGSLRVDLSGARPPDQTGIFSTGLIRRLVIFTIFTALLITGTSTAAVAYRQRSQVSRGWRDATSTPDLPIRALLPNGITGNKGVNVELTQYLAADSSLARLNHELDRIAAAGFTWVRQPFRWSQIEPIADAPDFSRYDVIVKAVTAHPSLRLIALLDETPVWARHAGAEGTVFAPPASPARFGTFAGQVAARYANTITVYQVWDEPNLTLHWGGLDPRPADYVALLRSAYTAIHGAAPDATVIAAALAPTTETGPRNLSDLDFLHALYADGGAPFFDAIAAKPYGFNSSPLDRTVSLDVLNFSRIILLREEMERQHDGAKPIWGSNFGWNSLPADWKGAPSIWGAVDAITQEKYTHDAYQRAATEWPWLTALILEHWQPDAPADDPIQGFAIADKIDRWQRNDALNAAHSSGLPVGLATLSDPRVTHTGAWRFGPLGADVQQNADQSDSQLSVSFDVPVSALSGGSVALSVRRADYVAYLYITIDGQPANALPRDPNGEAYLLLTSPDRQPHTDLITVARNLTPGTHQLALRAYLGYDRWELAAIAVGVPADTHSADVLMMGGALLIALGTIGMISFGRGIPWARVLIAQPALIAYARRMRDIALTVAVSLVTMLGMLFTIGGTLPSVFRQETPTLLLTALTAGLVYFSPALIVTAASLLVLFLIVYNRPPLGLALIVFWTPFFLWPVQLYIRLLPMVELSVAMTTLALLMRGSISWITRITTRQPLRIKLRALDWALLAFVIVGVATLLWSEQRAPALRELQTMILEPALFYLMLRVTPLDRRDVLRLIDTLLFAAIAVSIIGLAGYFHLIGPVGVVVAEQGSARLSSVYGSPNNVALFLGRCIPFALAFAIFPTTITRRIAAIGVLALLGVTALLTQSVGALLLGIPASVIVVLLAWNWRKGGALTLAIGALGALSLLILPRFVPRLQGVLSGTRASSFVRTQLWQSTINLLSERPLTGAGLDQFLYLYRSRYILPDAWREPDLSHPHNILLDYWVSLGIAGVALLIALQAAFWFSILQTYRRVRQKDGLLTALCVGAMGSMADFLAHGAVDNSYFVVDLAYVFCLTLGLAVWLARQTESIITPLAKTE